VKDRHLDESAGALADGELDSTEMAWAWAHFRTCPYCREAVDGQREVRATLRGLRGPHLPPDTLADLYGLPASAPSAAGHALPAPPTRRRRRRRVAMGSALTAVLLTAGMFALGGWGVSPAPAVSGARILADTTALTAAVSAGDLDEEDIDESGAIHAWLRADGWSVPAALPEGFYYSDFRTGVGTGENYVIVKVATPSGSIWTINWHIALSPGDLEGMKVETIGGRAVYVDEVATPKAGAWRVGPDFAVFVSDASDEDLAALIAASPPQARAGVGERFDRAWRGLGHLLRGDE
jgi:hypothetical protein